MIDRKLIRLIERGSVEYADVDVDINLAVEYYCKANGITSETIISLAQQYAIAVDTSYPDSYDLKVCRWIKQGEHNNATDDYMEQMEKEYVE